MQVKDIKAMFPRVTGFAVKADGFIRRLWRASIDDNLVVLGVSLMSAQLVSCIRSSPYYSKVSEKIGNRILARTGETD